MKNINRKVLIVAFIFITSTATFFILLCSNTGWEGFWPMILFTSLAVTSTASFMYLLVKSQLFRDMLKGYFGIY